MIQDGLSHRRRRRRGAGTSRELTPFEQLLLGAVSASVVGSMLLVGAVHAPIVLGFGLLLLGIGCAAIYRLTQINQLRWDNPTLIFLGLALFTTVQALPLPASVAAHLAPSTHAVWADALRPFGQPGPAWHSLSIDTGATWLEAVKWFSYAGAFAAAYVIALRGRANALLSMLLASAGLAAAVACAHRLLGIDRLYGLYEPRFAVTPWGVAPLLNPNNLSGYLLLGSFAGGALMLVRRPPIPRPLLGIAIAGVLAVLIVTGSRGGVLALATGIALLLLFLVLARFRRNAKGGQGSWTSVVGVVGVGALAAVFAILAAGEQTSTALQDASLTKLQIARWALPLIQEHWLTGVGRGAFETAFAAYRAGHGRLLFQYPENFVVQWLSEWGVVVSVAAGAALVLRLRPWRALATHSSGTLAIGLVAVLLHNLVDLGLEIMSLGLAFVVGLGALAGSMLRSDVALATAKTSELGRRAYPILLGIAAVALAANVAGWSLGLQTAIADREQLRARYDQLASEPREYSEFRSALRAAMLRHPGDAYLPLLGGLAAHRFGVDPIAWINRALERDPQRGAAHFLLAQVLLARGAVSQAMLALRLAVTRQPEFLSRAADLVLERSSTPDLVWQSIPEGPGGIPMLLAVATAADRASKSSIETIALVEEAARRDPSSISARLAQAQRLLKALQEGQEPCKHASRLECLNKVDGALRVLEALPEPRLDALLVKANRYAIDGNFAEAGRYLTSHCNRLAVAGGCLRQAIDYALRAADHNLSKDAITAYLAASCSSAQDCARASNWVGDQFRERQDWVAAAEYYARAVQERPDRSTWRKLAQAARAAGQLERSEQARARAERAIDD